MNASMTTVSRRARWVCALLLVLSMTSCIGPFSATRRLHTWNREIDNRWAGEGVFLVLRILPVYAVFAVGDLLLFNSIVFWEFEPWLEPPNPERIKALYAADDARAEEARAEKELGRQQAKEREAQEASAASDADSDG